MSSFRRIAGGKGSSNPSTPSLNEIPHDQSSSAASNTTQTGLPSPQTGDSLSSHSRVPSSPSTSSSSTSVTPLLARGIKSWTNGLGLVSSGHRQLDDILGGGLALGTVTGVECDEYSKYAETIQVYGLAESLSHGHETLVLHPSDKRSDVIQFTSQLPFNQNVVTTTATTTTTTTTTVVTPTPTPIQTPSNPIVSDSESQVSTNPCPPESHLATNSETINTIDDDGDNIHTGIDKGNHNGEGNNTKAAKNVEGSGSGSGLQIAWQYGKYLKAETNPTIDKKGVITSQANVLYSAQTSSLIPGVRYCCSYDLSRKLQSIILDRAPMTVYSGHTAMQPSSDPSCGNAHPTFESGSNINSTAPSDLASVINVWLSAIRSFLHSLGYTGSNVGGGTREQGNVGRIFIPNLDDLLWRYSRPMSQHEMPTTTTTTTTTAAAAEYKIICRFLVRVKQLIRGTRVSVTVSWNPSSMKSHFVETLRHVSDTVIAMESFAGYVSSIPYEFKEFCGFLVVKKIQQVGVLAPFRPPGTRFGLKRDRRKLHVEPLHLPPEESRAFGTAGEDPPRHLQGQRQVLSSQQQQQQPSSMAANSSLSSSSSSSLSTSTFPSAPSRTGYPTSIPTSSTSLKTRVEIESDIHESSHEPRVSIESQEGKGRSPAGTVESKDAASGPFRRLGGPSLSTPPHVGVGVGVAPIRGINISGVARSRIQSSSTHPPPQPPLQLGQGCGTLPGGKPKIDF